ncbi:hypothetical protein LZ31DRAFT_155807 [Colletotrichum somersetense]|nr:hypothetical protein LZ31DRAFT_155807 [Colletotrichum somersetense]
MQTQVIHETERTQPLSIHHHKMPNEVGCSPIDATPHPEASDNTESTNRTLKDEKTTPLVGRDETEIPCTVNRPAETDDKRFLYSKGKSVNQALYRGGISGSPSDGSRTFDTASPFIFRHKKSSLWVGKPADVPVPEPLRESWSKPGGVKERLQKDLHSTCHEMQRDGAGMPFNERLVTPELRMSRCTALMRSGSVTLHPCIWILCGSRWCKKRILKAVKDLSWTYTFVDRPIEVHTGGPRLATLHLSVPAVQVRWDQMAKDGIGYMGGRILHHVERDDSRIEHMSACGMLCCTTFARDGHVIEQHLSRIGGIMTKDFGVSFQGSQAPAITTAHGILDLLWSPPQQNQKAGPSGIKGSQASNAPAVDDDESDYDTDGIEDEFEDEWEGLGSRYYSQAVSWVSLRDVVGIHYMDHQISKEGMRNGWSKGADYMLLGPGPLWNFHNIYRSSQGTNVEVAGYTPNVTLESGPVSIVFSTDVVEEGYLLAERLQLPLWGEALDVRKVQLPRPLAAGTSGTWLLRDNLFCGMIVARYPWEPFALMITAEDVLQDAHESFREKLDSKEKTEVSQEPLYLAPPGLDLIKRVILWSQKLSSSYASTEVSEPAHTQIYSECPPSETNLSIVEGENGVTQQQNGMPTVVESTKPSTTDKQSKLLDQTSEAVSQLAIAPQVEDHAPEALTNSSSEPDGRQQSQDVTKPESQSALQTVRSTQKKDRTKGGLSVLVWTCCQCGDSGMTTNLPSCPSCYYQRCASCQTQRVRVKSLK